MKRTPVKHFSSSPIHFASTQPYQPLKHSPTRPSPRKQISERLFFDSVRNMSNIRSNNRNSNANLSILKCAIDTENTAEFIAKGYFKVNGMLIRCNLLRSLEVCFTVQLEVVHTQQPWVVIVPMTPSFQELSRIWTLRRRAPSVTTVTIANWLLSCLKFGFTDNMITSTEFNNEDLRKYVRETLRNEIDAAAATIQACVRRFLVRQVAVFMRKHLKRIDSMYFWVSPPDVRPLEPIAEPQETQHPLVRMAEDLDEGKRDSFRYVELTDNLELAPAPPMSPVKSPNSREASVKRGRMNTPGELLKMPPKSSEKRVIDRQLTNMSELDMIFYDVLSEDEETMQAAEAAMREAEETIRVERLRAEASQVLVRAARQLIRKKRLQANKLSNQLCANAFLSIIDTSTDYDNICAALRSAIDTGHTTLCLKTLEALLRVLTDKSKMVLFKDSKLRENLRIISDVGTNFASNPHITQLLLRVVGLICAIDESDALVSALGEAAVLDWLVAAMRRHQRKPEAVKDCCRVLIKLVMSSISNRRRICSQSTCDFYTELLRVYIRNTSVLDKVIRFLTMLCVESPSNQDEVGKSGIAHAIVLSLKEHVADAGMVKICTRALQNISARNHTSNQNAIASYANCRTFVDALEAHTQKPAIIIQVTTLILSLCNSRPDIRVNFGGIGLADAIEIIQKSKVLSSKENDILNSFIQKMSSNESIKKEFEEAGIVV